MKSPTKKNPMAQNMSNVALKLSEWEAVQDQDLWAL